MYVNYKKRTDYTEEQIAFMLATDDKWLEIAIVRLHERQITLEREAKTTIDKNEIGLQQADAKLFSQYAEQIRKRSTNGTPIGNCLNELQKRIARRPWRRPRVAIPTICKYRRQVLDMLEESARRQQESA
jgi:hypothetical protein